MLCVRPVSVVKLFDLMSIGEQKKNDFFVFCLFIWFLKIDLKSS